jgi:hypothetical protein
LISYFWCELPSRFAQLSSGSEEPIILPIEAAQATPIEINMSQETNMPMRITREEVLERTRGMLQKQLYVVFSKPTGSLERVLENVPEHLVHQCRIEREGILFAAGPQMTDDEKHWEGDGMFVYRASSIEHARQIAATDPMHQSGARSFTVHPWLVNEGRLNIQIDFSTGKMTLD